MITGGMRRPVEPSNPWTSLPQMPQAITFIATSPSPTHGVGTSLYARLLYCSSTKAIMPFFAAMFLGFHGFNLILTVNLGFILIGCAVHHLYIRRWTICLDGVAGSEDVTSV